MKIEGNELGLKKLIKAEEVEKKSKEIKAKEKGSDSESDSVSFSDDLKKAEEKVIDILNYPDKRSEKIESIKTMIKSGKYNVDVHKLTDKIIDDLLYGNFYQW